jgi:hypothetical protein
VAHLYDVALEVHEGAVEGEEANHFVAVVIVVADVAGGKMRELKGGGRSMGGKVRWEKWREVEMRGDGVVQAVAMNNAVNPVLFVCYPSLVVCVLKLRSQREEGEAK